MGYSKREGIMNAPARVRPRRYGVPTPTNVRIDVMAIHSGLSVTVAGHYVHLVRDEETKTARVTVEVLDGHVVTGLEVEAVKSAADLLRKRAERFLGMDWKVVGWKPPASRSNAG